MSGKSQTVLGFAAHLHKRQGCYPLHHQAFTKMDGINLVNNVVDCFDIYFRGHNSATPPGPLGTKKYVGPRRVKELFSFLLLKILINILGKRKDYVFKLL